jgi:hypothetical protein
MSFISKSSLHLTLPRSSPYSDKANGLELYPTLYVTYCFAFLPTQPNLVTKVKRDVNSIRVIHPQWSLNDIQSESIITDAHHLLETVRTQLSINPN